MTTVCWEELRTSNARKSFNTCILLIRSMRSCVAAISYFVLILLLVLPATAHVPVLPGDHNSLATSVHIKDPAVSSAMYGTLHEGGG
jgi:hypothetical protein